MEHRWYPRREFSCNALLYQAGKLLCTCRIKNVSPDGMFITQSDAVLDNGTCVDMVIDAKPLKNQPIRGKARVVHRASQGLGLMCMSGNPLYHLAAKTPT